MAGVKLRFGSGEPGCRYPSKPPGRRSGEVCTSLQPGFTHPAEGVPGIPITENASASTISEFEKLSPLSALTTLLYDGSSSP